MPRRRASSSAGWCLRACSIGVATALALAARQLGEDGRARLHHVADRYLRARFGRQVHVHARAEADEAVALAAREALARLHVAEDAPRDEAGDLDARNLGARVGAHDE